MSFGSISAEAHETLAIAMNRLDLVERDRRIAGLELEQPAQRGQRAVLVVAQPLELGELRAVTEPDRGLQRRDRRRVPLVELAPPLPLVLAAGRQIVAAAVAGARPE